MTWRLTVQTAYGCVDVTVAVSPGLDGDELIGIEPIPKRRRGIDDDVVAPLAAARTRIESLVKRSQLSGGNRAGG